ncbi:MAG: hypothetical protein KDI32_13970 [Pseudomonadales bacterium]|nr:hypothetical protein [Pseudomonadales bacterium]
MVVDHVSVALLPRATVAGLAVSVTVGAAGGFGTTTAAPVTSTMTLRLESPPAPVHVSANAFSGAVSGSETATPATD